jgi:hypothetical protein
MKEACNADSHRGASNSPNTSEDTMPTVSEVRRVHKNVPPYRYVRHEFTRTVGKREYYVFSYGAYDALGLIGPEENGITIASITDRQIVVDQIAKQPYGWYDGYNNLHAEDTLGREMDRLANLSDDEFIAFIRTHPRWRGHSA